MNKTQSFATFLIVLGLIASGPASANFLNNPGFEAGAGADADDWGEIVGGPSGTVERSSAMPDTGSFSAYLTVDHVNNPPAGGAYFIEQNQGANTIPDNTVDYDLSFRAKVDSSNFEGIDMFAQIQWLDQDGSDGGGFKGETLTSLIGLGISTSYQQFNLNDLDVSDGADSFLVRFQLSAGAVDNIQNGLYIDNVSLTPVPEPASMALVGLGCLAVVARRRR
ncbi:MAG: hypothetical protein CMJ18_05480 [Phycisphaeraceae bacterium]|nr:hypothetical protein [Phycisphaeraceae bacterium]